MWTESLPVGTDGRVAHVDFAAQRHAQDFVLFAAIAETTDQGDVHLLARVQLGRVVGDDALCNRYGDAATKRNWY